MCQMKRISGSHYFPHLFTNSTSVHPSLTALSLAECKLTFCSVLQRVYVGRIYSSIAQNLKFDWSVQVTWRGGAAVKSDLTEQAQIFVGTVTAKLTNSPHVVFSYPCQCRRFIWVIYSHSLKFFKIGVFKIFAKFTEKHLCWCLFSISLQLATFLIRDSTQVLSCELCEIVKNSILTEPFRTPAFAFVEKSFMKLMSEWLFQTF